ncbi:MAG: response regulator [Chloroflexi bacterium]|nr:response regulator [Chloroflexota bacterium]
MSQPVLRALIVEDDASWQQIMSEILTDCGLSVDLAGSLDEATALLKAQPHRMAVVDLSLSPNDHNNKDGLRVLEQARSLDPDCQTILLTGFATVELAVSALTDYGAFTFLRKESFQRSQFKNILQRILVSAPKSTGGIPPSAGPATGGERPAPAGSSHRKALIVDDDAGWRSVLTELLEEAGFQAHSSASFGEALGLLRREKYALAVIDLGLNEAVRKDSPAEPHGYPLLEVAKAGHIPAIVVSGVSAPDEIQKIYTRYSIAAYVEKQSFERAAFKRILAEMGTNRKVTDELGGLTEREREVLDLLALGLVNKEIADKLAISTNTVKRHLKAVFEKLGVHTRSAATAKVTNGKR